MSHIMLNSIWITWENQVRNVSMASMLDVKLYVIHYTGSKLLRYIRCIYKTIIIILKDRPHTVFAQNPSLVLIILLLCLRFYFNFKLVSDAHFAGVMSFSGNFVLQNALDLCNKYVDLVIVTNDEHVQHIIGIGGNAVVCEDPLPDIMKYYKDDFCEDKLVLYICSFDIDEPIAVAFEAAKLLAKDGFKFFVTGNFNKRNINVSEYSNITFMGYVSTADYYNLLFKSNVVLDLTESENCLLCGAYEAMSAVKPLVTSDTKILRHYFNLGTVFTNHDPISLANAIREAYINRLALKNEILYWKSVNAEHISARKYNIINELEISHRRQ
jgi:glycosyltransferase involved in cell wall biosynthesis